MSRQDTAHTPRDLLSVVDHLVLAVPGMEEGCRAAAQLLGIAPAAGGRHPRWKTQNALLSLGPSTYLEVMGPDSSPADPRHPRPFGIDGASSPRLVTWAARPTVTGSTATDLQGTATALGAAAAAAKSMGVDLGEVQPGSRRKPDGSLLQWSMTDLETDRLHGIIPFFIDWGSTPHPGGTAPAGCALEELRLFHPEAAQVRGVLERLGIRADVAEGPARIEAVIRTPLGRVVMT